MIHNLVCELEYVSWISRGGAIKYLSRLVWNPLVISHGKFNMNDGYLIEQNYSKNLALIFEGKIFAKALIFNTFTNGHYLIGTKWFCNAKNGL